MTFFDSALAISTSCCLPTPILVISVLGDSFEADLLHQLAGAAERLVQSMTPFSAGLVAEKHVLGDRQLRRERQFLVDDDDADVLAVGDPAEPPLLALVDDLAFVRAVGIDAAEHLHQRRFAGAVLAADRVDFAFLDREIDVVQRVRPPGTSW